jgi:hypothetical protein
MGEVSAVAGVQGVVIPSLQLDLDLGFGFERKVLNVGYALLVQISRRNKQPRSDPISKSNKEFGFDSIAPNVHSSFSSNFATYYQSNKSSTCPTTTSHMSAAAS